MARHSVSRASTAAALSLIAILMLTSCSSGNSSEGASVPNKQVTAQDSSISSNGGASKGIVPQSGKSTDSANKNIAEQDTAEILTASIGLRVKDPSVTATEIRKATSSMGGKVSYAVEKPGSEYEYGSAQLTLRVPPGKLDELMNTIESYGVLLNSESGSQDVSKEKKDYEVRIESLRTSIVRLNGLLAQSKSAADLIEIERELQAREADLESMSAMLAELNDRVDLATLSVTLTAENKNAQPEKVDPENFFTGFERGLEGLAAFGAGLLVFIGLSLPWILTLAVIGSIAMFFVTLARKRRRRVAPLAARSEAASPEDKDAPRENSDSENSKGIDG